MLSEREEHLISYKKEGQRIMLRMWNDNKRSENENSDLSTAKKKKK
jgi:hypothetical protein